MRSVDNVVLHGENSNKTKFDSALRIKYNIDGKTMADFRLHF